MDARVFLDFFDFAVVVLLLPEPEDLAWGISGQPQQSSKEQEDPESNTSKSKSAAVVLGPDINKGIY